MRYPHLAIALPIVALAACANPENAVERGVSAPRVQASAPILDASGNAKGMASISATTAGLRLTVDVTGISPGMHGIHIHTTGRCDAPGFTTAGSHWNPAMRQHGLENPMGSHRGDIPNLQVSADGSGALTYVLPGTTLAELMDADGSALVIHAVRDDQKSDPTGNSGDRIACGVFSRE